MDQRIGAVIAVAAALLVVAVGPRSTAHPPAPASLPDPDEAVPVELRVHGRAVRAATFLTPDPVETVIAAHRAAFTAAPVDLVERELVDGRLLSILDVPGGRHLVVRVRRFGGRTEVLRGESALGLAPEALPDFELPEGFVLTAAVEDRTGAAAARTGVALAPMAAAPAREALRRGHLGAGWREATSDDEVLRFERGAERLEARVVGGQSTVVVQLFRIDGGR
ncbi:hypothetical protein [Vulgatibacter sp.]|uniref:hypothetical protein n=1 Tax=Vulgatibacter sp. TaxID=1971226 RepID=UPI003563C54B